MAGGRLQKSVSVPSFSFGSSLLSARACIDGGGHHDEVRYDGGHHNRSHHDGSRHDGALHEEAQGDGDGSSAS